MYRTSLTDTIERKFRDYDTIKSAIEFNITNLIITLVGKDTPMTFNDETGYPTFDGCNDDMLNAVVGVRVVEKYGDYLIEFNCNCGDDDYGLDSDCWFNPKHYGAYDLENLYNNIISWAEVHNK